MKFFVPALLSVADATISLSLDKLTNFDAKLHATLDNVPIGGVQFVTANGNGQMHMNLFEGRMSLADHGTSRTEINCAGNPYAQYMSECSNPIVKGLIETNKAGAGEFFVDVTSGKFGLKGHETAENIHMHDAKYALSFCAVLDIPPRAHVLPPPAILKQRLNERSLKMVEQRMNSMPHTESDGVATFHSPQGNAEFSVHTNGGDPIHASWQHFDPTHHPDSAATVDFSEWNSPSAGFTPFTCPQDASTDLHAHPEALRTLALMNTVHSHLRQHEDLGPWLQENPAELFMAELERRNQQVATKTASQDFLGSMAVPLLAGVSGGLVVLAFFQMTSKNRKQEVLLTEA